MKSMKRFFSMMLMMATVFAFVACSDKEEEPVTPIDPNNPQQGIEDGRWTERGNQLIYTEKHSFCRLRHSKNCACYDVVWTLTFDGDSCTSSVVVYTFVSNSVANQFYQSLMQDQIGEKPKDLNLINLSGNTVTIDMTVAHRGMSREQLKSVIEASSGLF